MKLVLVILFLATFNACCTHKSNLQTATSNLKSNDNYSMILNTKPTIIYTQISRGFFESIEINGSDLTHTTGPEQSQKSTYKYPKAEAQTLMQILSKINLEALPTLQAPTNKRFYDAAPHATLTIQFENKTIQSAGFDHGTPPKEIENLVNQIYKIKQNLIKP